MKISETLFRFRSWVLTVLVVFGFWSPWERAGGTTWLFLAGALARYGILSIGNASIAVMAIAILLALLAALLRTWAAAYLGRGVVQGRALYGERVVADGPYRFLRNPLYLGLGMNVLALSILMPPSGALFAIVAVALLNIALIHAEERHLRAERGQAYTAYRKAVPRLIPALTPRVPGGETKPNWGSGFLGEIYFWGVAITYFAFAGRYNATILEQGVLISLGVGVLTQSVLRPGDTARA
ncbi:MAG: isoprenylcysteine carboxylmethyltransferase family protein [Acidobacteriaceae bacterium]